MTRSSGCNVLIQEYNLLYSVGDVGNRSPMTVEAARALGAALETMTLLRRLK